MTPVSKNTTVGTMVNFTCQHRHGDVIWRINEDRVDSYSAASTGSRAGLHTLTISNAPADYDGAKIQCMVFLNGHVAKASPATLRLQGLHGGI